MPRTTRATAFRTGVVCLLALTSCAAPPGYDPPVFHLCEANLWSVRASENARGAISGIDIVLDPQGSRDFELFAKRHYGEVIRFESGEQVLLEESIGAVIRGGRIQLHPTEDRGREVLERLLDPPKAPCGPAA